MRLKPCTRCKRLHPVSSGSSLCSECERERLRRQRASRDYHHEYVTRSQAEDKALRRFYKSREWRMVSRQYMVQAHHLCEECGAIGTDVHHVVPIQCPEGWRRRFDFENLRLLCVRCHNKAHGREFGSKG